jgi:hypothetical protein
LRSGFVLRSAESLGPHGALVVPKLFRRSVAFSTEARGMSFVVLRVVAREVGRG